MEESDECRSFQVIDHEETGPFYRVHDARSTDIPVRFEHDRGTTLGNRFENGCGTCELIRASAPRAMEHDREPRSAELPPASITEWRHRIKSIDGR